MTGVIFEDNVLGWWSWQGQESQWENPLWGIWRLLPTDRQETRSHGGGGRTLAFNRKERSGAWANSARGLKEISRVRAPLDKDWRVPNHSLGLSSTWACKDCRLTLHTWRCYLSLQMAADDLDTPFHCSGWGKGSTTENLLGLKK